MVRSNRLLGSLVRLSAAAMVGFTVALVVPRHRWRNRPLELPAGPWPPLDPADGA